MTIFTAFYSHSFDEKDKTISEQFKKVFESFGFKLYEHKGREGKNLTDEIIEHIKESDVFISLITKNSLWLTNELSIAYTIKQDKIILFYEEGVDISGVLSGDNIRKVSFERKDLLNSLIDNGILKTIYNFKENLIGEMYFPFYMIEERHTIRKIIDKDNYEVREKLTIVSLNDTLKEVTYSSRIINDFSLDISINKKDFQFKVIDKPSSNKKISYEILKNVPQEFRFVTIITPNLLKNEKLTYLFKYKRKNLKKFYKEDIDIENTSKLYSIYQGTYYQRTNVIIDQPTKKLILEVEFPENYKIITYGAYIFLNKTSNRNENEEKRVKVELIDRINIQILRLEVMYPKINHNYHLWWEPPSEKDLNI